jgi:heme-degrading monooxygenase HmoA
VVHALGGHDRHAQQRSTARANAWTRLADLLHGRSIDPRAYRGLRRGVKKSSPAIERGQQMFVRVTRTQMPPERLEQATTIFQQQIMPQQRNVPGCLGALMAADRTSGAGLAVTYWGSAQDLQASEQAGERIRAQAGQAAGATVRSVERYELVMQERTAPPQANTFLRINSVQGSPDKIEPMMEFVRGQVLPVLRQQPGFRAGIMGVDRQSGRMFFTSVWASAAEREASEARVRDARRQGGQVAGSDQVEVELYEVLFAEVSQAVSAGSA